MRAEFLSLTELQNSARSLPMVLVDFDLDESSAALSMAATRMGSGNKFFIALDIPAGFLLKPLDGCSTSSSISVALLASIGWFLFIVRQPFVMKGVIAFRCPSSSVSRSCGVIPVIWPYTVTGFSGSLNSLRLKTFGFSSHSIAERILDFPALLYPTRVRNL